MELAPLTPAPHAVPQYSSHYCTPSSTCAVWQRGPCCCPPTSSSSISSRRPRPPSRACCGPAPSCATPTWSCSSVQSSTSPSAQWPARTSWSGPGLHLSPLYPLCLALLLLLNSHPPTLQATVLEEMPPFPERESSILAKLKRKKGPGAASVLDDGRRDASSNDINGGVEPTPSTVVSPPGLGHREGPPGVSSLLTYVCTSCSRHPHPPPISWGCGQPLLQRHPRLPRVQATSWWTSPLMAQSPSPAWGPPPRRPSSGTICLGPWAPRLLSSPLNLFLPPCPCASVHLAAASLAYFLPLATLGLAAPGHPLLSFPITVSQSALPSLLPSSFFLFGPFAACLGLAACHACLLCLLWDWMAQRAGAACS